jgi:hypothetical protein
MNAHRIIILGFVLVLLTSCGRVPQPPTLQPVSTPTRTALPRPTVVPTDTAIPATSLFSGRLIVGHSDGIFALVSDPATGEIQEIELYNMGDNELAVSPDLHYLLYSNELGGTGVVDLSTFERTYSTSSYWYCLQWAPDSNRFSFLSINTPRLNVFTLDPQNSESIYSPPGESYTPKLSLTSSTYFGHVDCGYWIGENRVLFKSFTGPMPPEITLPDEPELDVNTTTLAILGEEIQLIHYPRLLSVNDISSDLSHILLRQGNEIYLADSFDDFANMNLRSLTDVADVRIDPGQFSPNNQEVILWSGDAINFVDIDTLQINTSFTFPPAWIDYGFTSLAEAEWVGDPTEGILIWNNANKDLRIGDLKSGIQTKFWELASDNTVSELIWLP